MPAFEQSRRCAAPLRSVWKLLHDPARVVEWFGDEDDWVEPGEGEIIYHTPAEPHPLPHSLDPRAAQSRVVFSCLTSGILFDWRLAPAGGGCEVHVRVEIPDSWAGYLERERALVGAQLERLAARAEAG